MRLKTTILNQSVGARVKNPSGEILGEITEMMKTDEKEESGYIILKSSVLFGRGERFFAIPAAASLINITNRGKIVLKLEKDDLQFAPGIAVEKCPQPPPLLNPSVFELYEYKTDADKAEHILNINN
jgi:hypothetical protein